MSKRTIYEHYADKDELLSVCLKAEMQQQQQAREEILESADNVIEGLFGVMNHVAESTREGDPNLLREAERFHPRVLEQVYETFVRERHERTEQLGRAHD